MFLIGAWHHLALAPAGELPRIFGDEGDGLFNLWILEHVRAAAPHGWAALSDGRIFWPENAGAFWWSDNLLFPAALHALLVTLTGDILTAYILSALVLSFFGFLIHGALYVFILRIVREAYPSVPGAVMWLAPAGAYAAAFSIVRIGDMVHYQTLVSPFLALMVLGGLDVLVSGRTRGIVLMGAGLLAVMYSTPYFALLGVCLVAVWVLFLAATRGGVTSMAVRGGWILALLALLLAPVAWAYLGGQHVEHLREEVLKRAVEPLALVWPGNRDAYLGTGLALGLVAGAVALLARWRAPLAAWLTDRRVLAGLALFALTLVNAGELKPWSGAVRLAVLVAGLVALLMWARCRGPSPVTLAIAFPAACSALVFAIASGPSTFYRPGQFDPGAWSLAAILLPGFDSIRDLQRFVPVGQGLLLGSLLGLAAAAMGVANGRWRLVVAAAAMALLLFQSIEAWPSKAIRTPIHPDHLRLTAEEQEAAAALNGPMLVLPTRPFHRNTFTMLTWMHSPGVTLVNGYSGRPSEVFADLMRLEELHGPASDPQIELALGLGVRYLCLVADRIPADRMHGLRQRFPAVLDGEHFVIVELIR